MDYQKQGEDFLKSCGVVLFAERAVPQTSPLWAEDGKHGTCWSITLCKLKTPLPAYEDKRFKPNHNDLRGNIARERSFMFWSSIASKEEASRCMSGVEKRPSAYDVLAGLNVDTSGTFEDFCSDYRYDSDSLRAFKSFQECKELNAKLEEIFTSTELEKLAEIQ